MNILICRAKHTKLQIPDGKWRCPKCKSDVKYFFIQENDEQASDECEMLHERDEIVCEKCHTAISGKKFAALYAKGHSLFPCPRCKGVGFVVETGL